MIENMEYENKQISLNKSSARTEQGFFASFFLALRAHERKKLGGIFQPSKFSAYLWIISFPLRDRSNMLRPLR